MTAGKPEGVLFILGRVRGENSTLQPLMKASTKNINLILLSVISVTAGCEYSSRDLTRFEAKISERHQRDTELLQKENETLKTHLAEQSRLNKALQSEIESLKAQLLELEKQKMELEDSQLKSGPTAGPAQTRRVKGRIKGINTAENMVIISVGQKQGFVSGMILLVYRETQVIGKIQVEKVEPDFAIGRSMQVEDIENFQLGDIVDSEVPKKAP